METVQLIFWIEKLRGALPRYLQIRSCSLPEEATVPPTQIREKEDDGEEVLCLHKKFPTSLRSNLTPLGVHKKKITRNEKESKARKQKQENVSGNSSV